MKKIEKSGVCWFCEKECMLKWYWHNECKKKWVEENR